MSWERWWVYDIAALLSDFELWPRPGMSNAEKLYALTRTLIFIFLILLILHQDEWAIYLLVWGLLLIIFTGFILEQLEAGQNNRNSPVHPVQQYLSVPRDSARIYPSQINLNLGKSASRSFRTRGW